MLTVAVYGCRRVGLCSSRPARSRRSSYRILAEFVGVQVSTHLCIRDQRSNLTP
jgi:hypothetical protein